MFKLNFINAVIGNYRRQGSAERRYIYAAESALGFAQELAVAAVKKYLGIANTINMPALYRNITYRPFKFKFLFLLTLCAEKHYPVIGAVAFAVENGNRAARTRAQTG